MLILGFTAFARNAECNTRLSLFDSVDLALQHNRALIAEEHHFEAKQDSVLEDKTLVSSNLFATSSGSQQTLLSQDLLSAETYTTSQAGFTYSHLLGINRALAHDIFSNEVEASETWSDLALLRMKIIFQTKSEYWLILATEMRRQVAQARVEQFRIINDIAGTRQRVGFGDRLETDWTSVQWGLAQDSLAEAESDLEEAKVDFRQLVGLPPEAEFELIDSLPYSWKSAQQLVNSEASGRTDPTVLAAQRSIEKAIADKQFARNPWWPQVTFTGAYSTPSGKNASMSVDSDYHFSVSANYPLRYDLPIYQNNYSALFNVSYLLWDGEKQDSRLKRADADVETAKSHLVDLENDWFRQLTEARLALERSISRVQRLEALQDAAKRNAEAARAKYQRNRLLLGQLIDVETDLATAQRTYIEAFYDLNVAAEQLSRELLKAPYDKETN